jgi:hypothetical protein
MPSHEQRVGQLSGFDPERGDDRRNKRVYRDRSSRYVTSVPSVERWNVTEIGKNQPFRATALRRRFPQMV